MAAPDMQKVEIVRSRLEDVMRSVVDDPSDLSLVARIGEQTVVYQTSCKQTDIGKLIGKEGRMATALRTLLISYSSRMGFRAVLELE